MAKHDVMVLSRGKSRNVQDEKSLSRPKKDYKTAISGNQAIEWAIAEGIKTGKLKKIRRSRSYHAKPYLKITQSVSDVSWEFGCDFSYDPADEYEWVSSKWNEEDDEN